MTPHRLHWLSAAVLVPVALLVVLLVVLLAPGRAISAGDPAAATVSPPAASFHGATPAVQSSRPFSRVVVIATSSLLTDVMAMVTATENQWETRFKAALSIDGGRTWLPFLALPDGWTGNPVNLAVVPRGDSRQPIRFMLGDGRNLYRTGDFGMTWGLSFAAPPSPNYSWPPISCGIYQVQSGAMPQILYLEQYCNEYEPMFPLRAGSLARQSTFYTSEDGGVNWRDLGVTNLFNLTPSPTVPNRLYAGDLNGFINYRSDDNGQTWQLLNTLPRDLVVLDEVDLDRQYAISGTNWLSPSAQVRQVSFDSGVTWENWASSPCVIDTPHERETFEHPLVSTGAGELWARRSVVSQDWYYSDDSGATWRWKASSNTEVLTADLAHPGRALMVNSQGLWRSDHGGSWQLLTATFRGPPPGNLYMPLLRH